MLDVVLSLLLLSLSFVCEIVELVRCSAEEELTLRIIENNEYTPTPCLVLVAFESTENFQILFIVQKDLQGSS